MGHGHIDPRGVQTPAELQTPPVPRVDPELAAVGHGQQGGLAVGAAVVQVEARRAAVLLLRGAGELQRLALCQLPEDHLSVSWVG